MDLFEKILLRLKEQLNIQTDKGVAEILGLSQKAFISRKLRNSFPEEKLLALTVRRPDLKIDVDYVLTGKPSPLMTRAEAKRLGILEVKTKDIFDKFEFVYDGDKSRDEEDFLLDSSPSHRLSQLEWDFIQYFRMLDSYVQLDIIEPLMNIDMSNKTTEDFKPAPSIPTNTTENIYPLTKDEWNIIRRFRCADLETKFPIMQTIKQMKEKNKSTTKEPSSQSSQTFNAPISGGDFAARDIVNHGRTRKK